jgi:hypothetical protein
MEKQTKELQQEIGKKISRRPLLLPKCRCDDTRDPIDPA